jgi:hypothetical protein
MADGLNHDVDDQQLAELTRAECREELELADEIFDLLSDGFNLLPSPFDGSDKRRLLIVQLATLGYNSLRQAQHCLLHGYYAQSIGLSRSAFDAWLHAAYLRLYKDIDLDQWLKNETRPRPADMRKAVAARSQNPEAEQRFLESTVNLYHSHSDFSHPSDEAVKILLTVADEERVTLGLGGTYNRPLLLTAVNLFVTPGHFLSTILSYVLTDISQEYSERGKAVADRANEWRRAIAPKVQQEGPRPSETPSKPLQPAHANGLASQESRSPNAGQPSSTSQTERTFNP